MVEHISNPPYTIVERETYRTVEPGVEEPESSWIEIVDADDNVIATLPGGSIYDAALFASAPYYIRALVELYGLLIDDEDSRSHLSHYAPTWYESIVKILTNEIIRASGGAKDGPGLW